MEAITKEKACLSALLMGCLMGLVFLDIWITVVTLNRPLDSDSVVSSNLFGMFQGVTACFIIAFYHFIYSDMDNRQRKSGAPKNMEKAVLYAIALAEKNKQDVDVERVPLNYFKKGYNFVYIDSACSWRNDEGVVTFKLFSEIRTKGGKVKMESERLPIEIAPVWLRKSKKYKEAIKEKTDEIRKVLTDKGCDVKSLALLEMQSI